MHASHPREIDPRLPVARWGARILSVPILLFWGWLFVAHVFGDAGRPSRPLVTADYVLLSSVVIALIGLAVAWKWEFPGATLTLAAVAAAAFFNWRVLIFPGTLIPLTALLYLAAWWVSRSPRGEPAG